IARRHLERALRPHTYPAPRLPVPIPNELAARATLSNVLWMQGLPDQAVRCAQSALDGARAANHALTLCMVLAHAVCPIALYVGNLTAAEGWVANLLEHSAKHALTMWNALGRCVKGTLLLAQGDIAGLPLLRAALEVS